MNDSNQKHSSFKELIHGNIVQDDYLLDINHFETPFLNYERPAQIPIRKSRFNYLINEHSPKESDRWIMLNQPNHFYVYDKNTKFCIYDAEYIYIEDQFEDPDPICAAIIKLKINSDPNQHPSDFEDDLGTVADLLVKEF